MGCTMNRCVKCGVHILDKTEVCPLCHCVVEDEGAEPAKEYYPDIRLKGKKIELVVRIVLFLSIVVGALSIIINVTHQNGMWWCVIVIGGLAYLQLIMLFLIENQHAGYLSKIIIGTACGIAYIVLIDYLFGFTRWSLNYAVPAALLAIDIMTVVLMVVNIRSWQSYLSLQLFMIVCSGIGILLFLAGVVTKPVMSYVVFGISCMLFLATLIIGGRRASNELKRRFHVM